MNHAEIHASARGAADVLALPLRRERFAGSAGPLSGRGSGSSLEFHDQRRYVPGDDPRHINWLATARGGEYVLKQWREEVSPCIDILLDHSPSMFLFPAKARRVWELAYFAIEAARRSGARLRILRLGRERGTAPEAIAPERALAHDWPAVPAPPRAPAPLAADPSRADPRPCSSAADGARITARPLPAASAEVAPSAAEERDPDWSGNVEFEDCETGARRFSLVDETIMARYRAAWQRHVGAWRESAARRGIGMAMVAAEGPFLDALRGEALPAGVVEPW